MAHNVRAVARALNGQVASGMGVLAPGPNHSASDRSLSVRIDSDAPDGFLVHSFAGDAWQDCREHVRERLGLLPRVPWRFEDAPEPATPRPVNTTQSAHRLWTEAHPLPGTLAEHYLTMRGVRLAEALQDGEALRFHPACPFRLSNGELVRLPAMLGAMVDIATGTFRGVHRTALASDGSAKAAVPGLDNPKKMLGSAKGACIKLSPDDSVTTGLHVAEGIETALACMTMGFAPVWAALSVGGIASFPVLSGIEAITVFADHDESGTGLDAARSCSERWVQAGCEARIRTPPKCGTDWADGDEALS